MDTNALLERQHEELLERLASQDEMLQAILEVPRMAFPFEEVKKDQHVDFVSPVASRVHSSDQEDSVKKRLSKQSKQSKQSNSTPSPNRGAPPKTTFTLPLRSFSAFDMSLKNTADAADGDRSRRRYASLRFKSPNPENNTFIAQIVRHALFDLFFGLVVVTNSILIGVEVELSLESDKIPVGLQVTGFCYTVLFALELGLRIAAFGCSYFCSEDWAWAFLDLFIVLTSLGEMVLEIIILMTNQEAEGGSLAGISSLKALRIIRISRLIKTMRLMRILRFVMALRTLITSIFHTLKSLFWALMLLVLVIYVFAVLFAQTVNSYVNDEEMPDLPPPELAAAKLYFGSLGDTMLTLFMSISGGLSWNEAIRPLRAISDMWILMYLFFISFTYFAVLNVVTAVFCQTAIESAQNDHLALVHSIMENKEAHLEKIRGLFMELGAEQEDSGITFAMLEEKIDAPGVRAYFESLGLSVIDAWSFFKLLDLDNGGSVDVEEFLRGCLNLRGTARAIDVGKIIHEQTWLLRSQGRLQAYVETQFSQLQKMLLRIGNYMALPTSSALGTPGLGTPAIFRKNGEAYDVDAADESVGFFKDITAGQ